MLRKPLPGGRLYSTAPSATEPAAATAVSEATAAAAAAEQSPVTQPQQQTASSSGRRRKSKEWQGPFAYHQELTLRVESLTNLGVGVCRHELEEGERWVVMVPTVAPGELVRVRVYRNHKNYSEADLLEVLEPSPDRVEPACPVRGSATCAGCCAVRRGSD
jgi:predicted RNA-binding protein with TRAM domain